MLISILHANVKHDTHQPDITNTSCRAHALAYICAILHARFVIDTITEIVGDKCDIYTGGGNLGTVGGVRASDACILQTASSDCITPAGRLAPYNQGKTSIGMLLPDQSRVTACFPS